MKCTKLHRAYSLSPSLCCCIRHLQSSSYHHHQTPHCGCIPMDQVNSRFHQNFRKSRNFQWISANL